MKFTFGIITSGHPNVNTIIESIVSQNIPEYEIIVVGGKKIKHPNVRYIPFDNPVKDRWITKMKNIITENAKYDNIVYMHDYISLTEGWYNEFVKFGDDWDICMNRMVNENWGRYRDWTMFPDKVEDIIVNRSHVLLPYDVYWMQKYMYISGAYWVAKKHVMISEPLDERLVWGEAEDVEWSDRVLGKYKYVMNEHSIVKLLKHKHPKFRLITDEDLETVKGLK